MLVGGAESGRGRVGGCHGLGLGRSCGRGQADDTRTSVAAVKGLVYSRLRLIFPEIRIWLHRRGNKLTT